jgi:glucokinase
MKDSPIYFGVEIGGTKLQALAASGEGRILRQRRTNVHHAEGAAGIRATILAELRTLQREFSPAAIGVGFGGPVDWRTGVIVRSFHVEGWNGFALAPWLQAELGDIPVVVENDAKAAALAEANFGAGRGHRVVFYSNAGSGVGAGLVIDGDLYRGRPPGELELGHVRLDLAGHTVEERASGWSLDKRVRHQAKLEPAGRLAGLVSAAHGAGAEAQLLTVALADGDPAAGEILDDAARDYAYGLSHVAHLLHPEIIVLGGGVSLLGEPWRAAVARHLDEFLMEAFRPGPPVVLAALGEAVVPLGAAMIARRRARLATGRCGVVSPLRLWINRYLEAQHQVLDRVKPDGIAEVIELLQEANIEKRRIFVCGNGGNAANASHFVTDLGKNASEASPSPFRVLSINDNVSWMTAIGNDHAYEEVFVRQLVNHAEAGDVLITSSVSGSSPNVVRALEWAHAQGLKTIALVGARRGRAAELADRVIVVEDTHYGRVEDTQMQILHMLCYAFVEKAVQF